MKIHIYIKKSKEKKGDIKDGNESGNVKKKWKMAKERKKKEKEKLQKHLERNTLVLLFHFFRNGLLKISHLNKHPNSFSQLTIFFLCIHLDTNTLVVAFLI